MAKKYNRSVGVLWSDTHGGFKFGLMRPGIELKDEHEKEWSPEPTFYQDLMYRALVRIKESVMSLAEKDDIFVMHLGDATHGNHYGDKELVSTRLADHYAIAKDNMSFWLDEPQVKYLSMIKGTGVHEWGQGSTTAILADALKEKYRNKRIEMCGHSYLTAFGVDFDLAHHGPSPGIRNWLRGNVLRLYVRSLMMDDIMAGKRPPDIIVRGHFHDYVPETMKIRANGTTYKTEGIILPSFAMLDDYARKVAKSPGSVTFGIAAVEIINGRIYKIHDSEPEFMEKIDLRTRTEVGNA